MASGTLGISNPSANTWTTVYQVPTGKVSTVNIRVTNTSSSTGCALRLAIGAANGAPPSIAEYIEQIDYIMEAGEVLEDYAVVIGDGDKVKIFVSTANIAVRIHGFEANQ